MMFSAENLLILGVLIVAAIFVAVAVTKGRYPYRKAGPLLSAAERHFISTLELACEGRFRICTKVRIADLVQVKKGVGGKEGIVALNKIAAKHVDYVLVEPTTWEALAAIELDDSSHQRGDRVARDSFVNKVFEVVNLPLVRVPAKRNYSASELRMQIDSAIAGAAAKAAGVK